MYSCTGPRLQIYRFTTRINERELLQSEGEESRLECSVYLDCCRKILSPHPLLVGEIYE